VERLFQALAMSIRYYVDDPDFYRTLWTGLFDMNGKEVRAALARPERDAFWLALVKAAADEGALLPMIDTATLLRDLDFTFGAVMLNWVLGALATDELQPAAAYGYALTLRGAATSEWQDRLAAKIADHQAQLIALRRRAAAA
jgi:hypothetical protein